MDQAQQIRLLQLTYAAQLADTVRQYERAGILDRVTEERRAARGAAGAAQAAQMGITGPADAFTASAELFGCADWVVRSDEATPGGAAFTATADRCLLYAMVKKTGAASPCRLFCLDPIEAMVEGLAPGAGFEVEETLYDGAQCRVTVRQ